MRATPRAGALAPPRAGQRDCVSRAAHRGAARRGVRCAVTIEQEEAGATRAGSMDDVSTVVRDVRGGGDDGEVDGVFARAAGDVTSSVASSSSSDASVSALDSAFAALGRGVAAVSVAAAVLSAVGTASVANDASIFTGSTGAPASASCANGTLSESRLKRARAVMTCNQDNWREDCLNNYDDDNFYYVDGPGLTEVRGKKQMERYLRNQFDFSRQFLTVKEETCAADSYIATWSLDMLLSTGPLRNLSGISTLKFKPDSDMIVFHRDYLADGAITENSPIVGGLVKLQRQTYTSCMQTEIGCAKILGGVSK